MLRTVQANSIAFQFSGLFYHSRPSGSLVFNMVPFVVGTPRSSRLLLRGSMSLDTRGCLPL